MFRTVVDDVSSLGYDVMAAIEYEVRIWDEHGEPLSSGISYSLNEIGRYDRFVDALVGALQSLDVELSAVHTEAGPGLLELNLAPGRGLAAADGAVLAKFATKQVAASMGLRASFLAKTVPGRGGVERTRPPIVLGRRHERLRGRCGPTIRSRIRSPPRSRASWSTCRPRRCS